MDTDVSKLHMTGMTKQTDMTTVAQHSWMPAQRFGIANVIQITTRDQDSIEEHFDVPSHRMDFIRVPLSCLLQRAWFCGENPVQRSAALSWLQIIILWRIVVE